MIRTILSLILIFQTVLLFGQDAPGKIKILLLDRLTGEPLTSTTFTLVLNDNDKSVLTTGLDGSIFTRELPVGKYRVEIVCENYLSYSLSNIILGTGKTTYMAWNLTPARKLARKEKRKLGLK